jgi:NTP pyrophosphatase (non-canonical NTP hydrolase)
MHYGQFVKNLFKPGKEIAETMTPEKATRLDGSCVAIIEECKFLDRLKKWAIYNDPSKAAITDPDPAHKDFKLTPEKANLLHAAIGLVTEAGELLEAIHGHVFDDKPLDIENVVEELGDQEFYLEAMRQAASWPDFEIDRDLVIAKNIEKLQKRYAKGYTDQAAKDRADKQAGE